MIYWLWHRLVMGHRWRERDVTFYPGHGRYLLFADGTHTWATGEVTEIVLTCDCAAIKVHRLNGRHDSSSAEIDQLRKMAGIA